MCKHQDAYEIFTETAKEICLLHLVAMGEFDHDADMRDAVQWFYDLKEDCDNCPYHQNCLVCLFTAKVDG